MCYNDEMLFEHIDPGEPNRDRLLSIYGQRVHEEERFQLISQTIDTSHCHDVVYLGSGGDPSVARGFAGKRVINVDFYKPNLDVLTELEPAAETHFADADTFVPPTADGKTDILVFSGPFFPSSLQHLRPRGFLLLTGGPNAIDEVRKEPGIHLIDVLWKNDNPKPGEHYRISGDSGIERYIEPDTDLEALRNEDPILLEQIATRRSAGDILRSSVEIAREIRGYLPRKKGHAMDKPDMYVFQKN
jgi:hypothetical protein